MSIRGTALDLAATYDDLPPRGMLLREVIDYFGLTDPEEILSAAYCDDEQAELAMQEVSQ